MPHPILTAGIDPELPTSLQKELAEACHDLQLQPVLKRQPAELLPRFARYYAHLTHLPRRVRRQLQRQWKRSLSALALLLALGQAPALAATLDVTTNTPDITADGQCSLIEAIVNANDDAATHADCVPGSGPDTINLPTNGTHTLTVSNNSAYGANGLPLVHSTITIEGHGSTITRSSADAFRILAVSSSGTLTLNETTVSGGLATGSLVVSGGGISVRQGVLTLTNSTVLGNSAGRNGDGVITSSAPRPSRAAPSRAI